jgi:TonB family protein
MKTSTRLRFACVVTLALLVLSSAFVIVAAASGATTGAQKTNTTARHKRTARARRTRRKTTTREAVPMATGRGVSTSTPLSEVPDVEPPSPPAPRPTPKSSIVSGGILNGKAISKPAPVYPPIARAARAQGLVTVQVVVDESGRVISASAVSGHPLLQSAAVAAARQARFSPTLLSGQPVKVSGVITYNFVLNPPTPY